MFDFYSFERSQFLLKRQLRYGYFLFLGHYNEFNKYFVSLATKLNDPDGYTTKSSVQTGCKPLKLTYLFYLLIDDVKIKFLFY